MDKTKEQLIQELAEARQQIAAYQQTVDEQFQLAHLTIDHAPETIFLIRDDGTFARVNNTSCEMLGYSHEELMSLSVFDIDPVFPQEALPNIWHQLKEEKQLVMESEHQTKTGRRFPVEIILIYLEHNEQEYICAFARDITDRKQTEKTLRENQQLLRGFVDNVSAMVYAKDIEGRYLLINRKLADMLNHSVDDMLGHNDYDFFPTEVADAMRTFDRQIMEQGAFEQEEVVIHPDGSEHIYLSIKFPLYDESGTAYGVGGISADITERKQAEIELQRQAQFQEAVLNNAPYAIIVGDSEGTIQTFNPAAERMVGYTAAEVLGQSPALFHDPAEVVQRAQEFSAELGTTIEPGFEVFVAKSRRNLPNQHQWTYIHKEGHRFPVLLSVAAMENNEGNIVGFIGSAIDISAQREMEAERERLQQKIIEAQQQAIQELSSPVIPVMEGIIVMPLIGSIDSGRAQELMRSLLQGISQHRAKIIILDITGVPIVDTGVVAHLDKTIQAARLKGTRAIVTGISDAVAEALVDLGIDWSRVETLRDLQTGLMVALASVGFELRHIQ